MTTTPTDEVLLRRATRASVAVALLLLAIKSWGWWQTGSVAVLAALVDSLMDAGASLINLLAVRFALTPPDRAHRYGHGKAEALAGLGQSVLIFGSALFLVAESVHRLLVPASPEQVLAGVAVMATSMAATLGLVLYQRRVIARTHSTAIRADSLHYRADLLSNAAVLLVLLLAERGMPWLDPLLALAIAAYTLVSVRDILQAALDELLDRELPRETRDALLATALAYPGVLGAHDLRTRRAGRTLFVELHIELEDELPLCDAHVISDGVEACICERWPEADVTLHQDPFGVAEASRDAAISAGER